MIVFSRICYGLHYSTKGCLFTLLCHCLSDFWSRWAFKGARPFRFWLSHHLWFFNRLLCWDGGGYPSGLSSCDSPVDHSFETTMDSSKRACRVRGVRPIVTHHQVWWFSQMGYEAILIVDLTIPTHQRSIFWDSWSLFQTISADWELWWHATLGHIFPHHFLIVWRSEPSFTV